MEDQGTPRPGPRSRGSRVLALLSLAVLGLSLGCATVDRTLDRARIPCGVYRWRIKTLSDPDAQSIRWQPIDTTIRDLTTMSSPAWFDRRKRNSSEFYVYRVRAILAKVHRNIDQDLHLLLRDPDNPRARLVAEIPNPSCTRFDALDPAYEAARRTARALRARREPILVEVTGVGFFDRLHKPRGAASNHFELHPVLDLEEVRQPAEPTATR